MVTVRSPLGLLQVWSTTAFWILAKSLHLRSMLSKSKDALQHLQPALVNRKGPILHGQCLPSHCTTNAFFLPWSASQSAVVAISPSKDTGHVAPWNLSTQRLGEGDQQHLSFTLCWWESCDLTLTAGMPARAGKGCRPSAVPWFLSGTNFAWKRNCSRSHRKSLPELEEELRCLRITSSKSHFACSVCGQGQTTNYRQREKWALRSPVAFREWSPKNLP